MKRILMVAGAFVCLGILPSRAATQFSVELPTPREHYKTYDADAAALDLMAKVLNDLDPETRALAMSFLQSGAGPHELPPLDQGQALAMIEKFGLRKYKAEMLEVFLHKSQVLELVPEENRETVLPIVHDALLAFMDGLSDERLAERLVTMARVPPDTPRGEKVLILASKIPTLQKFGQIIARAGFIPPDVSEFLQTLESGIRTMSRDELVGYIEESVGEEAIRQYRIEFDSKILAEASVGAVIKGSFHDPRDGRRKPMVCKLIKPYAVVGLPEEIKIIDGLIDLADRNAEFYALKGMPLKDLFADIQAKLREEIRVAQEQDNFHRAYQYYAGVPGVYVPEIFPFSTETITFMEFFEGVKISDAFPGDDNQRAILARRLADVMAYDALFSKSPVTLIHGDPHAGNVMHLHNRPGEPYAIGLLDWGLIGEFDQQRRMQMVQLNLALRSKNRKKLHKNVGALIRGGLPADPARRSQILELADGALEKEWTSSFQAYADLIADLTKAGFILDSNFSVFVKSQVTLTGIYRSLDPDLLIDDYLEQRTKKQVLRELPHRLLLFPAISYRGYRSMLSNGDVFRQIF